MINIDDHKIVDIIESRKDSDVAKWLKTFPNLELVSRDGALCYKNAISEANKDIMQVSDRFHLLKNLTSYCKDFLLKKFSKFIYLNKSKDEIQIIKLQEKYKLFIKKKLFKNNKESICKDLDITHSIYKQFDAKFKKENPISNIRKDDFRVIQNYNKKIEIINKTRELRDENYNITQICKTLKLDYRTVKKYLDPNFNYDNSRNKVSNLSPFESIIEHNINKKIQITTIYRLLQEKGYTGSYSNLRAYCRRFNSMTIKYRGTNSKDKVEMKHVIKFLYHPLDELKGITSKDFESIFKEYPIIKTIYNVVFDFKAIVFETKNTKDFTSWLTEVKSLNISELNSFVAGVERDITAVFNAIVVKHNNGLAEGTVNKIKFIKRIMYGRCKFDTLRNKILIAEKYN